MPNLAATAGSSALSSGGLRTQLPRADRLVSVTWRSSAAGLGVLAVLIGGTTVHAEVDRDLYRSATWGVELVAPEGWVLSEQTAYPEILVVATHRESAARLSLAAQHDRSA